MYVVALYHNLYSNEGKFVGSNHRPTATHPTPAPYRSRARVTPLAELAMMNSYICWWFVVAMLGASPLRPPDVQRVRGGHARHFVPAPVIPLQTDSSIFYQIVNRHLMFRHHHVKSDKK